MVQSKLRFSTFEEYLSYDDGTDNLYELFNEEHVQLLARRNTIRLSMAPPLLVVEVVSPGELQRALCEIPTRGRDYVAKRQQYENLGVPEYWIVDSEAQTVTVLELQEANYVEVGLFREGNQIRTLTFPDLNLTVDQVFAAAQ